MMTLKSNYITVVVLFTLLCSACSNSQIDHASRQTEQSGKQEATTDLASLTNNTTMPHSPNGLASMETISSTQQKYPEADLCAVLDGCKRTQPLSASASEAQTATPMPPPRTGGAGTHHQTSIYPNMDVDLTQLPGEDNVQYVNGIYTSLVKNKENAELSQKAEFRNVRFNQIRSPSSLNTINMVMTDDKSVNGTLEQSFKFKSVEMIQRDSAGSVHAMNYLGDKPR